MRDKTPPQIWLSLLLLLGMSAVALANPNDYPEYAQKKVDGDISITFIKPEDVKDNLDAAVEQTLIDVRKTNQYKKNHLPGAVSLPLRKLPERHAEIPRDTPSVLY